MGFVWQDLKTAVGWFPNLRVGHYQISIIYKYYYGIVHDDSLYTSLPVFYMMKTWEVLSSRQDSVYKQYHCRKVPVYPPQKKVALYPGHPMMFNIACSIENMGWPRYEVIRKHEYCMLFIHAVMLLWSS